MKVLIIGSGGREHSLAWKLSRSPRVTGILCAPGNAGTAALGKNFPISPTDLPALVDLARREGVGLTVAGPDDALAAGVADAFAAAGLRLFGPTASAARLESSKIFAKEFMRRHGIPAAASREFSDSSEALAYARGKSYPLVIKADGLALGKGVIIAANPAEAETAIHDSMVAGTFGDSGRRVVIEDFLTGPECSIHALVDGSSYGLFPDCRDHKRAFDGDRGPNTGGMGTISPCGSLDAALWDRVRVEIMDRFLGGLRSDGLAFRGMLFPGLILTSDGPKVLEFNCRWGDPETQVLVRRLRSDLLDLLEATVEGRLADVHPEWDERHAVCVILASGGYPGSYAKGKPIGGIADAESDPDVVVFHAGTASGDGGLVTNGGRVLGVTALGDTPATARAKAYAAADRIYFEGLQRRGDIGITHQQSA